MSEEIFEFPDNLDDSQELRKSFEKRRKTARGKGTNLPRRKTSKNSKRGIPNLSTLKSEPLNVPYSLKLWLSISSYLEKNGGPDFIREAILEKLQRILDEPTPARCCDCQNLTTRDAKPFCKILLGFLGEKKLLKQKFSCDYFQPRKEAKRGG